MAFLPPSLVSVLTLLLLLQSAVWRASAAGDPVYVFSYDQTCPHTMSGSTYVFSLSLTTTFVSGTSTISSDAKYLIIGLTGSVTIDGGSPQAASYVAPFFRDNDLFPYGQITDNHGFGVTYSASTGTLFSAVIFQLSDQSDYSVAPNCNDAQVALVPSSVSDPFFTGFWGQRYTVNGEAGAVYSILSDAYVQVSASLVWLASIDDCPLQSNGVVMDGCTNHSGTYFGAMSLRSQAGEVVVIEAGSGQQGFTSVTVNGQQLLVGQSNGNASHKHHGSHPTVLVRGQHSDNDSAPTPTPALRSSAPRSSLYVHWLSSHSLTVHASVYELGIANADHYVDLQQVRQTCQQCVMQQLQPEGLLGRTWNQSMGEMSEQDVLQHKEQDGQLTGCNYATRKFTC